MSSPIQNLVPVVLAGGSGTRLWPVSRSLYPKHLASLVGDSSLLQETLRRAADMAASDDIIVVGAANQGALIMRQARTLDINLEKNLLLEPCARNTAAAVALAAHQAIETNGTEAVIYVCPSDHLILSLTTLRTAVEAGMTAARRGKLVTFGINPDRPETGFGYIKQGASIDGAAGVFDVERFVEKPELNVAKAMLAEGTYAWNSGMFLMRADVLLQELANFEPELASDVAKAFHARDISTGSVPQDLFERVKSTPIDKAVMERSKQVAVVPCDPQWSDLGSWHALWEIMDKDGSENALMGDAMVEDGARNLVRAGSRLVALAGVSDLAVIETEDALLVVDRNNSAVVKTVVGRLADGNRPEVDRHSKQLQPWGELQTKCATAGYSVRQMTIDPKQEVELDTETKFDFGVVLAGSGVICGIGPEHPIAKTQSFDLARDANAIINPNDEPLIILATSLQ